MFLGPCLLLGAGVLGDLKDIRERSAAGTDQSRIAFGEKCRHLGEGCTNVLQHPKILGPFAGEHKGDLAIRVERFCGEVDTSGIVE